MGLQEIELTMKIFHVITAAYHRLRSKSRLKLTAQRGANKGGPP